MRLTIVFGLTLCLIAQSFAGWVNELHYDNDGADVGEGVEIVLEPGELIENFTLEFYNGSNGTSYNNIPNTGWTAGQTTDGYQVYHAFVAGIQNGAPDGLALIESGVVDVSGGVIQFLSYEGSFTATGGAANGLTSLDIGVFEPPSKPVGQSLQLQGSGFNYSDFTWVDPLASFGAVNQGQFIAIPEPSSVAFMFISFAGVVFASYWRGKRNAPRL